MRLTLQAKLLPTEEQTRPLAATQQQYVQLCNYLSELVLQTRVTNPHSMYYIFNRDLRYMFPDLPSALHTCARAKVAGAYRSRITKYKRRVQQGRKSNSMINPCRFKDNSTVDYNKLCYSIVNFERVETEHVSVAGACSAVRLSIATIAGRVKVDALLPNVTINRMGSWTQATLTYRKDTKTWYFLVAVEVAEPQLQEYNQYLGVDLGIINIATTSDGEIYSGAVIDNKRAKYYTHVRKLQKCNTRSARRRLSSIRRRMSNFIRTTNHTIAQLIVTAAQRSGACLVLEELKHLHASLKARKPQRMRMFGWSYAQLRDYICYKAKLLGISVMLVDPQYSSQTCRMCGHTERANRHGEEFRCKMCDHVDHADVNAAINLATLGMLADHYQNQGLTAPAYSR